MGFWNKFDCFNSIYQSSSSVNECIASIVSEKTFGKDFYNPQYYDYKVLSSNQMLLVFKGAKFGKAVKTEYIATFYDNPKGCKIILAFQRELLCLPPMTPTCLLDLFMEQKIQAYRCQN